MRKIVLILIALIPTFCFAQMDTTTFIYTKIDTIPASKQELFVRARNFAFDILKNPKAAIQINDSVSGKIMIHTIIPAQSKRLSGNISLTINIDVKDNKCRFKADEYKYAILPDKYEYDMVSTEFPGKIILMRKAVLDESWYEIRQGAIKTTEDIYQAYKTYMNKNDNW